MEVMAMQYTADNARKQLARIFAQSLHENVLPLLSAVEPKDQISALAIEADKLMQAYANHLIESCKIYQKMAEDALNSCIANPISIR